jgi:hypothetical protein
MFEKWKTNVEIIGSKAKSCCKWSVTPLSEGKMVMNE